MSDKTITVSATLFSLFGNVLLALIKGLAGFFGNSFALIADAIESTTDIFSSLIMLVGLKYAYKPADSKHPYGHGRIEPLITFIIVGFLIISATIIAYESIQNITIPHEAPQKWTLYVLGAIIVWKELSFRIVLKKSKQIGSTVLKADAWHHRSDAITSVAALIGISIAILMGPGYENADDWAALFASAIILYNSYLIFKPALSEILDEDVYHDLISEIRTISSSVAGVVGTEKCRIRKLGTRYHVDLHVVVSNHITVLEGHQIAHRLKDTLIEKFSQIDNVLIHIEPD